MVRRFDEPDLRAKKASQMTYEEMADYYKTIYSPAAYAEWLKGARIIHKRNHPEPIKPTLSEIRNAMAAHFAQKAKEAAAKKEARATARAKASAALKAAKTQAASAPAALAGGKKRKPARR